MGTQMGLVVLSVNIAVILKIAKRAGDDFLSQLEYMHQQKY